MRDNPLSLLMRLHGMLEYDPLESEEEFSKMVQTVFVTCAVPKEDMAAASDYSVADIDGWLAGNIPEEHNWPYITKRIMAVIHDYVEKRDFGLRPEQLNPERPLKIVPASAEIISFKKNRDPK